MSQRSLITALLVGIVSLMTLAGLVLAVFIAVGDGSGMGLGGRVAVLEVDGIIADDQRFLEDVRQLRDDRSVRGWVVAVNSPGGVVAPSQSIYQTIRLLREEDDRPVIAAIGSVGASGGYYVALGADSILALPGSITGSIGVLMELPNVQGLMEKVGVTMEVVKAGDQKDLGSPFSPMGDDDRAILQDMLEDVHEQFVEAVSRERRMAVQDVQPLADGRIFSGRQAQALGLVDRLGNMQEAVALAGTMAGLGTDPRVVRPRRDEIPWLVEALIGAPAVKAIRRLADPMAGSLPVLKYVLY